MKKRLFFVSTLIGALILYATYSHIGIPKVSFDNFSYRLLAIYLSAVLLIEFFLVLRWRIILDSYEIKVPFHTLFLYKMSGYAIGYLSPQPHIGGEPIRAMLLKRNKVSFAKGISTVLIDKSMQLTTDVVFSAFGVLLLFLHLSLSTGLEMVLIAMLIVPIVLLVLFFSRMIKQKPFFSAVIPDSLIIKFKKLRRIKKHILEVEDIIHAFYDRNVWAFVKIITINIALWMIMIVEYGAAMQLFGFEPDLLSIFIIMGGVALSYSLPVPMALGVLELSQVSALGFLKLNNAIGLSMSLLIRIKDLVRSAIGIVSLIYYGMSWKFIVKEIGKKKQ